MIPESVDVEHILEREMSGAHLSIQTVKVLRSPFDARLDSFLAQAALRRRLDLVHDSLAVPAHLLDLGLQHTVAPRVEGAESEILELDPDASKSETIGDGSVDLERLPGDAPALVERQRIEGAHVVQPVRELDEHDSQIAGHRHQHPSRKFSAWASARLPNERWVSLLTPSTSSAMVSPKLLAIWGLAVGVSSMTSWRSAATIVS